jgi:exodeoxyribonuclease VII large subunit
MNDAPVLTVSQATNAIKLCLESNFPLLWIQGEISNFKLQTSGHLYFSLKDANAQLAAVMFRADATKLKILPKDGDHIIVRGELNVYPPSGKYQMVVRDLQLMGLGALLQKLEERKIKLHKLGWFDPIHKKPLPKLPKVIGVVTSPTGAAIQDILNILTRRFSGFELILNPVKVQGEGAAEEIAEAIHFFNQYKLVDVMIVGRGGGSIEDLWAFNEEIVAKAIFESQIPIISAVGHETDHCIADYVADVRAPTPSAAAEIVIAEKAKEQQHLLQLTRRLVDTVQHIIRHDKKRLDGILKQPVFNSPLTLLGKWMQRLDDLRQDLDQSIYNDLSRKRLMLQAQNRHLQSLKPTTQIAHFRQKLNYWDKALQVAIKQRHAQLKKSLLEKTEKLTYTWQSKQDKRRHLFSAEGRVKELNDLWQRGLKLRKEKLFNTTQALQVVNPKNLLTKGYCILFSEKESSVITSVHSVEKDDPIKVILSDGNLITTVKDIVPK